MKKILILFCLLCLRLIPQSGYDIKITLNGNEEKKFYLGVYRFDKTYLVDSCFNVSKGQIRFKAEKNLEAGMYILIDPNKRIVFDFLLNECSKFQITANNNDITNTLKSVDCKENEELFSYIKAFKTIKSYNESVAFDKKYLNEHRNSFWNDFVNLKLDKIAPQVPLAKNGRPDSVYQYEYYKQHYWDGVNFGDDRLIRTPVFANKFIKYFDKVLLQTPDALIPEIDKTLDYCKPGSEMYRYLISHLISTYERSKIMGFDKLFVHLVDKYVKSGRAKDIWDDVATEKIIKRANDMRFSLIGANAYLFKGKDFKGSDFYLANSVSQFKVIKFIKKLNNDNSAVELASLKQLEENAGLRGVSLNIILVYLGDNSAEFNEAFSKDEFKNWTHILPASAFEKQNIITFYDLWASETNFVLSDQNVIIAKKLAAHQTFNAIQLEKFPLKLNEYAKTNDKHTTDSPNTNASVTQNNSNKNGTKKSGEEDSQEIYASNVDFKSPGKYYAIIIGVSSYKDNAIPDLDSLPIKDAISLRKTLNKNYIFEKENIKELLNPTRRDIVIAFSEMAKKVTPTDNLLIFYAGHGHYEKENDIGYWLPADAEVTNPSNWLYNDQLVADIKKIKSLHTLLISDACFSGSIFKTRSVNMEDASTYIKQKYQLPSRKAITSGTLKTVPNKSVFIKYLLDRLTNNKEKYFTASQLFQSLEQPVSNNSNSLPQSGVIQNVGDEGGDFIFIKRQ